MMQYRLGRSVRGSLSASWQKESTPSACEIWSSGQTATRPFQTLLDAPYLRRLSSSLSRAVHQEALAPAYGWSDAQQPGDHAVEVVVVETAICESGVISATRPPRTPKRMIEHRALMGHVVV